MAEWKNVLDVGKFPEYSITEISVPDIQNNNVCRNTGKPFRILPAILVSRIPASAEPSAETAVRLRDTVRSIMIMLHSHGIECRGFADGGCGYCGICAGYEACRYPAMMIRPVSELYSDTFVCLESDWVRPAPYGLIVLNQHH